MSTGNESGEPRLRWRMFTPPRWVRILYAVVLVVFVVRAVWAWVDFASTGDGLGQVAWTTLVALAFIVLEVRMRTPVESRVCHDHLEVARPIRPRRTPWAQVKDVRIENPGPWTQGVVAELEGGRVIPVYPPQDGGMAMLETPEVSRFIEVAQERIAEQAAD